MRAILVPHSDIPAGQRMPVDARPDAVAHELLDVAGHRRPLEPRAPADRGRRGVSDPTLTTLAFLGAAAFVAGWIDAVVGGGGLVQLPGPARRAAGGVAGAAARDEQVRLDLRHGDELGHLLPPGAPRPAHRAADGGRRLRRVDRRGAHRAAHPQVGVQPDHPRAARPRRRLHALQARPRHGVDPALPRGPAHRARDADRLRHRGLRRRARARAPAASSSSPSSGCSATTSSRRAPRPRSPTSRRTSGP